jgi:hypothetical protein
MDIMSKGTRRGDHIVLVVLTALLLLPARIAIAGQQSASVFGQVMDESGAVLPGVAVSASGPALQVAVVTDVTDEKGEFRLTPLPIGTYTVTYELAGFQTVRREGIRLTIGFAAKVDAVMKIGGVQETLTVTGASPVVDVTSTAATSRLTRENLDDLPLAARNSLIGVLSVAPGVRTNLDIGGNSLNIRPQFRAFGRSGEEWDLIEGVMGHRVFGPYVDYAAIEESSVTTVGNGAEVPTRGIKVETIFKSGGNDFHGSVDYAQTPQKLIANNLDDKAKALGATVGVPIKLRYDVGGDLGGRLIRDRLWFYTAVRERINKNYADDGGPILTHDGARAENINLARFLTTKESLQLTPSHRIVGLFYLGYKWQTVNVPFADWSARDSKPTYSPWPGYKVEWQGIVSRNLAVTALFGRFDSSNVGFDTSHGPGITDRPAGGEGVSTFDIFTQRRTGENPGVGRHFDNMVSHSKASLSWFRGQHGLKLGGDYIKSYDGSAFDDRTVGNSTQDGTADNYELRFNNRVPFQLIAWAYPTASGEPTYARADMFDLYVQDKWTLLRNLTLDLGLRYQYTPGYINGGSVPATWISPARTTERIDLKTWNSVAPRLHAAYQIGSGRPTVINGGYGRFNHPRTNSEVAGVRPTNPETVTYRWSDPNGNRRYDSGEVNLDRSGPDFVSLSGGTTTILNPDEVQPTTDEYILSIEREMLPAFGLRFTTVYTKEKNQYRTLNAARPPSAYTIPVSRPDPGPDGLVGTADDTGRTLTYYEYPVALRGRAFEQNMTTWNDPRSQDFLSYEFAASKRLAQNWQFLASYSATKIHLPYIDTAVTPNSELFGEQETWEYGAKAAGSYNAPYDILVSAAFENRSGQPWGRTVLLTGGTTIPSQVVRVEPIGAHRTPAINLTNLRLEKQFNLGGGRQARANLNFYNVFNRNTVLNVITQSGPTFQKATALTNDGAIIMNPRTVEFTLAYRF